MLGVELGVALGVLLGVAVGVALPLGLAFVLSFRPPFQPHPASFAPPESACPPLGVRRAAAIDVTALAELAADPAALCAAAERAPREERATATPSAMAEENIARDMGHLRL